MKAVEGEALFVTWVRPLGNDQAEFQPICAPTPYPDIIEVDDQISPGMFATTRLVGDDPNGD